MFEPMFHAPDELREPRRRCGYAMVTVAAKRLRVNGTVSKVMLGCGISSGELTGVQTHSSDHSCSPQRQVSLASSQLPVWLVDRDRLRLARRVAGADAGIRGSR